MSLSRVGFAGAVILMMTAGALAAPVFTEVPPWTGPSNAGATFTGERTDIRAMTPDGTYLVGNCTGLDNGSTPATYGVIWDATNGSRKVLSSDGALATTCTGADYRIVDGSTQLVVAGLSAGWATAWFSNDGGISWLKKARATNVGSSPSLANGNTLRGTSTDVAYFIWKDGDKYHYTSMVVGTTNPPSLTNTPKSISSGKMLMNSVANTGRVAGRRYDSAAPYLITLFEYPPAGGNQTQLPGLDGTLRGEVWAVNADGTQLFGISPVSDGRAGNWPFKMVISGVHPNVTQVSINELPTYPDTAGSTSNGLPYGASADGTFACGMNYRGQERAVLWDLRDAEPANWKVYDLTSYLAASGNLGSFSRLNRAHTVAVNANDVVVAGIGVLSTTGKTTGWCLRIPLADLPFPDTGACCMIGACGDKFAADCPDIEGQQRWTANKLCANAACPGACCTDSMTGACSDFVESATCTDGGGVFRGASSACSAGVCLASCCKTDGTCGAEPPGYCESIDGIAGALGSVCEASTCLGACCVKAGQCEEMNYGVCPAAKFKGIGTSCATEECPCSIPFADADGDGDVDQADFALFQVCIGANLPAEPACACFDAHPAGAPDGDVDTDDWSAFEACASGSGITADPACGGALP